MQTQTSTETTKPEPPIADRIETARAQLAKLKQAVDDASAEAKRWALAFEREPTAQADTEARVCGQKAKNAATAAATFEQEVLQALIDEKRNAERALVGAEVERERVAVLGQFDDAADAVVAAAQMLDGALAALTAYHATCVRAGGAPGGGRAFSLERTCAQLNERLAAARGRIQQDQLTENAHIHFTRGGGHDQRIVVELTRSATKVPANFW